MSFIRKNVIGFADTAENGDGGAVTVEAAPAETKEPVSCIAKVRFEGSGPALDYYNDEFYLEPGDRVFVSGKYYGKRGLVESVTTHFRVDKNKYRKVIAKNDLHVTGRFIRANDKMISFDTNLDAERFASLMIPPRDPENDEEEEIVCGDGWSVDLTDFEESECVDCDKIMPALDYCTDGNVLYFSLINGKGTAFIKGKSIYKTEFEFDGKTVSGMFCSCPFNDDCLCKHEIAVLITLRMLLSRPELEDKADFTALDYTLFRDFFTNGSKEITLK